MAKLHGREKAAFLARMARGRKKHRRGKGAKARARSKRRRHAGGHKRRRSHARRRHSKKRRRSNPGVEALLVNPSGGSHMARRRKHSKKHRRAHGRRRHRNPMGGGMIKGAMGAITGIALPAAVAGAAAGFLKAKFLASKSALVQTLATVGLGVGAAVALKKNPTRAAAAAGAIFGSIGYAQGVKMGGGLVLGDKVHALADADGIGIVLNEEMHGLGTVVEMHSLSEGEGEGMADADVDGMGDHDEAASGL